MNILLAPHVSEKSTVVADKHRQIVFKVRRDANKRDIKEAVEKLFDVEVSQVRALIMKGKRKSFRQKTGQRKNWKKAYVTLKEGHDIQFSTTEM